MMSVCLGACATASAPAPATRVASQPLQLPEGVHLDVTHLLNRAAFGPSPADVERVQRLGVAGWLEEQLAPGVDAQVEHRLSGFKTLKLSVAQAYEAYPPPKQRLKELGIDPATVKDDAAMKEKLKELRKEDKDTLPRELIIEATQAKLIRVIQSQRQLEEVLVDFWFNHFNVSAEKGRTRWMVTAFEREAIRPHVLGKFRELLGATAKHPAMLMYLDNWQSVRDGFEPRAKLKEAAAAKLPHGLNENYARELLELHTLGVDAGYTQADVREAARALTGWSLERAKSGEFGQFTFRAQAHYTGAKRIFGLELPAGGTQSDGEALLDFVARHPATAHHLALQLCQRFVGDEPPAALVDRVAAEFLRTDGDLRATVRIIFESREFWSPEAMASKTKTPLEFVASAVRAVGHLDEVQQPLAQVLERMGMPQYRCGPPTGYSDLARPWVSAGALVTRINFGLQLAAGRVRGVDVALPAPSMAADATIDAVSMRVLGRLPSAQTRGIIEHALHARAEELGDEQSPTANPQLIAGLLLGSPEFQKQ